MSMTDSRARTLNARIYQSRPSARMFALNCAIPVTSAMVSCGSPFSTSESFTQSLCPPVALCTRKYPHVLPAFCHSSVPFAQTAPIGQSFPVWLRKNLNRPTSYAPGVPVRLIGGEPSEWVKMNESYVLLKADTNDLSNAVLKEEL